jgi:DNA-binding response OmpR family regulator/anti-sigma regulatory factor (Ser/Thr protein kinase)
MASLNNSGAPVNKGNVLIAEDEPLCRRFIEKALEAEGYTAFVRESAGAIVRELEHRGGSFFHAVITGYTFRRSDDIGLLTRIGQIDPSLAVVVIGDGGKDDVALRSLRTGACDFIEKPLSRDLLARAVGRAVLTTAERRRSTRMEASVRAAGLLQKTLLGSVLSDEGIAIERCFRPREAAGGDFLAHYRLPGGQDLMLVTDVSGHEFDSAVMSSFFHGMARGLIELGVPVEEVLTRYNRVLLTTPGFEASPSSLAVCCLRIDYDQDRMTIFLAGSPPPAWVDESGWIETWNGSMSSPLGWFLDSCPAVATSAVPRGPVWIWTDGVEDLAAELGAHPLSIASALVASTLNCVDPGWLDAARDDVLAVRLWPTSATGQRDRYPEPVVADRYNRGHIPQIDDLQLMWERSLRIAFPGITPATLFDVLLSAREALLNGLMHGTAGDEETRFQISVRLASAESGAGDVEVVVRVEDPGPGYTDSDMLPESEFRDGHRGLLLIRNLASSVSTSNRGASVTMRFRQGENINDIDSSSAHSFADVGNLQNAI